ncbi:hypothetical protein DPMN_085557 [Dreissena polymorpha]|uniref:Uncharacterized protein n=1 Tax=Dreissena polymorpha TaxID=45954 RepID=A0A9D3YGQ1_DREPO|nr:hypothetical protein DPMN_085557 [Dreissena polymorpha]
MTRGQTLSSKSDTLCYTLLRFYEGLSRFPTNEGALIKDGHVLLDFITLGKFPRALSRSFTISYDTYTRHPFKLASDPFLCSTAAGSTTPAFLCCQPTTPTGETK